MKKMMFVLYFVFATAAVATAQTKDYGTCEARPYVYDNEVSGSSFRNPACPDAPKAKPAARPAPLDPNKPVPAIRAAGCKEGAPDPLGLCNSSKESEKRVPVVVGAAQGMEKVQEYSNQYFYGRNVYIPVQPRYNYYDTYGDMGVALQRVVSNKLFDLGYGPKAPHTGAMNHDTKVIEAEISRAQAANIPEVEADLVVVTAYGFLNNGTSATSVDGCRMAHTTDQATRGVRRGKLAEKVADIVTGVGCTVGSVSVSKKTEAVLFVGIYKPDGQLVKRFQATDSFSWGEYREVGVLGVGHIDQNSPTLQLLAKRLVDKAFGNPVPVANPATQAPPKLKRR